MGYVSALAMNEIWLLTETVAFALLGEVLQVDHDQSCLTGRASIVHGVIPMRREPPGG